MYFLAAIVDNELPPPYIYLSALAYTMPFISEIDSLPTSLACQSALSKNL